MQKKKKKINKKKYKVKFKKGVKLNIKKF